MNTNAEKPDTVMKSYRLPREFARRLKDLAWRLRITQTKVLVDGAESEMRKLEKTKAAR